MENVTQLINKAFGYLSSLDFGLLVVLDFGAFAAIFVAAFVLSLASQKVRGAPKRAFFHLVNLFSAVTLSIFCSEYSLAQSVAITAVFWCIGVLAYGLLCAISKPKLAAPEPSGMTVSAVSASASVPVAPPRTPAAPAAQSGVRLEHALSITDKLLLKNLGRGDRQELEKIKTSLTVLKVKGVLSPQEGETLNETFNALLKFMAKYDV